MTGVELERFDYVLFDWPLYLGLLLLDVAEVMRVGIVLKLLHVDTDSSNA